jgi:hypothetical protein
MQSVLWLYKDRSSPYAHYNMHEIIAEINRILDNLDDKNDHIYKSLCNTWYEHTDVLNKMSVGREPTKRQHLLAAYTALRNMTKQAAAPSLPSRNNPPWDRRILDAARDNRLSLFIILSHLIIIMLKQIRRKAVT